MAFSVETLLHHKRGIREQAQLLHDETDREILALQDEASDEVPLSQFLDDMIDSEPLSDEYEQATMENNIIGLFIVEGGILGVRMIAKTFGLSINVARKFMNDRIQKDPETTPWCSVHGNSSLFILRASLSPAPISLG